MLRSKSATGAWLDTLDLIKTNGHGTVPRGQQTRELLHHSICVDMCRPVVAVKERELSYKFMAAEAIWILQGSDLVYDIAPYNKNIAQFSDDGVTFFGAYGPKINEQHHHVLRKLLDDRDTRQAVLTIWRENPPNTKDYPCTIAMAFQIRRNMLHAHVFMRSSDVWLGLPYDIFNFTMVALRLACNYNEENPEHPVTLGELYLTMASSHLYEKDKEKAYAISKSATLGVHPGESMPTAEMFKGNWRYYWSSLYHCRDSVERPAGDLANLWVIRP